MGSPSPLPSSIQFLVSGLSGMAATCVVQPLDLVKTRMQVAGTTKEYATAYQAVRGIIAKEGVFAMYTGLGAGLLRQATYTTTRLGVYNYLFDLWKSTHSTPSFASKIGLGMVAGVIGAFVGTPAEVVLIRMTTDGRLPLNERRNYKNVFDAILRIVKEEGLLSLWRGVVPTMSRAMVVNGAQLSSYSQAKQMLLATGNFEENITLHFCSSMISGLVTTVCSMPVDIAKTRIQNMKVIDGKPEYKGGFDVVRKIITKEGPLMLWKGFVPYFARLGPHTVLTFIFLEQLTGFYRNMNKISKSS
ncbi:hypothetical protein FQR65_LT01715 [Abscondita terminalis]|nr:hypothetical protein FQR65_LT01715 [Abscondita terminalis]